MAKVVCSLCLFVGIPSLMPVIFGAQNLDATATIFPFFNPNVVYFTLFETPINGIYLSTITVTVVVLVALTALLRYTNLGLQMRGAVESRRLVQLDGVNSGGVVAIAWAISSFMAGLAGVLLAPIYGAFQATTTPRSMVAAIAAAAWGLLRSIPIATGVAVLIGVVSTTLQGYLPTASLLYSAVLPRSRSSSWWRPCSSCPACGRSTSAGTPSPPSIHRPRRRPPPRGPRRWTGSSAGPGGCSSPPSASPCSPGFPRPGRRSSTRGLALSTVLLSITLITGMAGQLSLCQATLAGVGAFTSAQLAIHLGLNMLVGGLVGAALAAAVAVVLALLSLRLRGLGSGPHDAGRRAAVRQHLLQRRVDHAAGPRA